MEITLTEFESAINYWRAQSPSSGEEQSLSSEVNLLASVYALMIFNRSKSIAMNTLPDNVRDLLRIWQDSKHDPI